MKLKLIVLETNKTSKVFKFNVSKSLQFKKTEENLKESKNYHIYLVDPKAKIKEGDWCINNNQDTLYQPNCLGDLTGWNKVIYSTNESLSDIYNKEEVAYTGIPPRKGMVQFPNKNKVLQLSDKSIRFLINHYNMNSKTLNEIEIKKDLIPTLMKSQRTVDIVVLEEKKYSKQELRPLFLKMCHDTRDYIIDDQSNEFNVDTWIENNLK